MLVSALTDLGRVRRVNEDALHVGGDLLVVADGMGGHAAGEVASQVAVATISAWPDWSLPAQALRAAFTAANEAVLARAAQDTAYTGMGTTMTACYFRGDQLFVAHVGDSRLYLHRQHELSAVTHDHSVVGELMRIGGLSKEEARVHPQRNVLTRALGAGVHLDVDLLTITLRPADRLLLCTDGLLNMVNEAEINQILSACKAPADATARLVHAANDRGGFDNITIIVADITKEDLA